LAIPVIDLFAGPGGLGEGFSALSDGKEDRIFRIALSVEKEANAHQTLTLRSFYRQFDGGEVPDDYYDFLKGKLSLSNLYFMWPEQAEKAREEAWHAMLGEGLGAVSAHEVDQRIDAALDGRKDWLLIGGPPCQAYSIVGRSRRGDKILDEAKDERVGLYKQYLRILAVHSPSVFVMENVKGLLSAATKESSMFDKMLADLKDPVSAYLSDGRKNGRPMDCPGYRIYSLVVRPNMDLYGDPEYDRQMDFVIMTEKYGIPQARHRVILLGVRKDIDVIPGILQPTEEIPISKVLSGLPRIRSGISKAEDSDELWKAAIFRIAEKGVLDEVDDKVREEIYKNLEQITLPQNGIGRDYIPYAATTVGYRPEWYLDEKIKGVCNHSSKAHMESDLYRYFFISSFARVNKISPTLGDFPKALLPAHKNVAEGKDFDIFADRFRVQIWNRPSKTITSHISKDGHYYIHPDPTQCRSLTVREAARIQTFPDNYFFCGTRTAQFTQVGNAVPPLLAHQIANVVLKIFKSFLNEGNKKHPQRLKNV
jgi:DNA (cytosine-5)-methyltransferase 1